MDENTMCGFIVYSRNFGGKETGGYIGLLTINSKYRKRNFGKQLLDEAEKNLATLGCSSFFLRCQNRKAFCFFTKCGFHMKPATEKHEYTTWGKKNPDCDTQVMRNTDAQTNSSRWSFMSIQRSLSSLIAPKSAAAILTGFIAGYLACPYLSQLIKKHFSPKNYCISRLLNGI